MNNKIIVTVTAAASETFARALGITIEREVQIDELMDQCHAQTHSYPDAIAAISTGLENANELAYASFYLGSFAESQRRRYELLWKLLE